VVDQPTADQADVRRRLSASAQRDIASTLDWSHANFGEDVRWRYQLLIESGLRFITAPQDPIGARHLDDRPGVMLFHLRHCPSERRRPAVRNPRHLLIYRRPETDLILVLRFLHDAMDIKARMDDAI
jgi:toxin ParE1/3/4